MKNEKNIAVAKAFFILLVMCCFSSCSSNLDKQRRLQESSTNVNGYVITIVEYDSCEYLVSGAYQSQMITHKGNCKYCAKRSLK